MKEPFALAADAAALLHGQSGVDSFDVGVVLGSGWKEGAAGLGTEIARTPTSMLPGFLAPTVPGHQGEIISVELGGLRVAFLAGRTHLYEGHGPLAVAHPVRTLVAAGARTIILTNACGGLNPAHGAGTVALLRDQINLTGTSPLEGPPPPEPFGSRFVDVSNLYDRDLRASIRAAAPELVEGVYAGFRGPQYETPAEVEMARVLGASLVGMSTVLESIAAHHMGAKVVGLSLISNLAAGVSHSALDHREVLEAGQRAAGALGNILERTLLTLS